MQAHTVGDLLPVSIDQTIHADASFEAKIDWLNFIEPTIHVLWHQGKTTVKPVFLMTEDDLVH